MKRAIFILFTLSLVLFSSQKLQSQSEKIEDPYIWLEDIEGDKSMEWVKEQNKLSEVIADQPLFKSLEEKILEVYNDKDKIAYPTIVGEFVYNLWQDEKNERGVWRRMKRTDYLNNKLEWETVLDLDKLSEKENKKWVFSGADWLAPDNKICLLYLSDGGTDKDVLREFNAETKEFVKNGFTHNDSKGGASWMDENTLLIARNFGEGSLTTSGYARIVKKWKRGTSIDDAKTIFEGDSTNISVGSYSNYYNGKQQSFIYRGITFYERELYFLSGNKLQKINYPIDAEISGTHKNQLILHLQSNWEINDKTYTTGSLVSFDLNEFLSGNVNIETIYKPNERSSFSSMIDSKDYIIVNIMENVQNKLIKYKFENKKWIGKKIDAPEFGSIYLVGSSDQTNDYFFQYSNLITPSTLYYGNDKSIKEIKKLKEYFNAEDLVVKQYEVSSKDGTTIPYFIIHKNNIQFNGENPTLIYAYGGFNIAMQPNYSALRGLGWLEQGGVYVLANIRGGGEFGPSWHKAAMKEKRQNAYDDFYAVSEDIINKKITSPDYLGAFGWSNGGLMAGVVFTQRPDLYNAVVIGAPLLDMKRYSKMLAGASWIGEYGDPDIPEEWDYIKKYSPYHNVFKDKKYPEVLFITSTKDDRVHPGHARKMAAKMIDMGHPIYYHETIEGGHGAASTNKQKAYVSATLYTYLNMKLMNKAVKKK